MRGGVIEEKAVREKETGEERVRIKSISCSQKICNLSLKRSGSLRTSLLVELQGLWLAGKKYKREGEKREKKSKV